MKLRKMFAKEFSSLAESDSFVEQIHKILSYPESECIVLRNKSSCTMRGRHLRYGMEFEVCVYNNMIFGEFLPCVEIIIHHLDDLVLKEILPEIFLDILSGMKQI